MLSIGQLCTDASIYGLKMYMKTIKAVSHTVTDQLTLGSVPYAEWIFYGITVLIAIITMRVEVMVNAIKRGERQVMNILRSFDNLTYTISHPQA